MLDGLDGTINAVSTQALQRSREFVAFDTGRSGRLQDASDVSFLYCGHLCIYVTISYHFNPFHGFLSAQCKNRCVIPKTSARSSLQRDRCVAPSETE